MNNIIIDAHLHIYPYYNINTLFSALNKNFNIALSTISNSISLNNTVKIGLLAERFDCNFFNEMMKENKDFNNNNNINVRKTKEKECIKIQFEDSILFLIAGRQIITNEGIEVLAYGTLNLIEDGKNLHDTIKEILNLNSVPALPFAPGKWLLKKGEILKHLLNEKLVEKCIFVDSALRPFFWGIPDILKTAKKQNIKILHGSDPLPFKGDENNAGIFSSFTEADFDEDFPYNSIKDILYNKSISIKGVNSKESLLRPIFRILKNYLYR